MSSQKRDVLRQLAANGTIADSEIAEQISVGLEGFTKRWEGEILPFIAAGGSDLRFVVGSYGRGKTHLLRVLSKLADEKGFLTCYTNCGTDAEPFESLEMTYQAIARNICLRKDGETYLGIHRVLESLDNDQLMSLRNSHYVPAPLRNLCRAYRNFLHDKTVARETKADLCELLLANKAHRVLFRELFRRTPSLPRPITRISKRNAGQWLRGILSLPKQLGFNGLVVFFDETGADLHIRGSSRKKRQEHMANLRNLIDHMAVGDLPGCSIIYGVTHDLLEMAAEDYPALAQRIERTDIPDMWEERQPNPRAVWTPLDELTSPSPSSRIFFESLGERLATLAKEAEMLAKNHLEIDQIVTEAVEMAENSAQGDTIRAFVKRVTSQIIC